jgi:hypothetical protein
LLKFHSEENKGVDAENTEKDKYGQNEEPQKEGKEREVLVPKEKSDYRERKRNGAFRYGLNRAAFGDRILQTRSGPNGLTQKSPC